MDLACGGTDTSGAWPPSGSYYQQGWWRADAALSTLRRQVGANHRFLLARCRKQEAP